MHEYQTIYIVACYSTITPRTFQVITFSEFFNFYLHAGNLIECFSILFFTEVGPCADTNFIYTASRPHTVVNQANSLGRL